MDHQGRRATGDFSEYFHGRARARVEPEERARGVQPHAAQEERNGEISDFVRVKLLSEWLFSSSQQLFVWNFHFSPCISELLAVIFPR